MMLSTNSKIRWSAVVALIIIGIAGATWLFRYAGAGKDVLPYDGSSAAISYSVEEVVSGLEVPWSIVWTSPERMLVAERPGRLRVVQDGHLLAEPLITFEDVAHRSESGLMGIAVDPKFSENNYIYACYAYENSGTMKGRVVRLIDKGTSATIDKILIDDIPSAAYHAGCRVAFGPDGALYITTGDSTNKDLAQQKDSLAGKILRINSDGFIPADNPDPSSPVWSYGHRNPQGIAWHPQTKELYETEHGPSVNDGPAGGDEINRIVKNGNYGWPLVSHEKIKEGTIAPIALYTPAEAPASAAFYQGSFFFGALKGEGLIKIDFDAENPDSILSQQKLGEVQFGRIREVAAGPDGWLYFTTSNRDGRGKPQQGDDRIFRIKPENN